MGRTVVLITGIGGFVGSHLAELCLLQGCEVHGTFRNPYRLDNLSAILKRLRLHQCDLTEAQMVRQVIDEVCPQLVFHLAAQASVPASWKDPAGTIANNVTCQTNLLEALRGKEARIHLACSSEEYGGMNLGQLLNEEAPLQPRTPYGISKMAQDLLGAQYAQAYGMQIVRTRAFNHTGPRLGVPYVTSNFAHQIAMIEKGLQEPVLKVGNLSAKRNYTDVRDIAQAYWLCLQGDCKSGEVYNICGRDCRSIGELLDIMMSCSRVPIRVEVDPERLRPVDVPVFDGDNRKFVEATGWQPEIALEQTLTDLVAYWRKELGK